ncbi:hypothetical protein [Deinococcus sp. UYEF24]
MTSFGIWRRASLVLIPAGLVHVGIADGLFNRWVRNKEYRIPYTGFIKSTFLIASISMIYTSMAYLLGYFKLDVFGFVASSVFVFGVYSIASSYIQSHSEAKLYPVYFIMQPAILLVMVLVSIYIFRENLAPKYLFMSYTVSFFVPVFALSSKMICGSGQIDFRDLLFGSGQGVRIMVANICLLVSMNIDKLILGMFVSGRIFGSYSLLSALPFAASTIGYPIGLAIYSRGIDRRAVKVVSSFSAVLGACVFYYIFKHFEIEIEKFYKFFNFSLLPFFLIASVCIFVMSMAYYPVRRFEIPGKFSVECSFVAILITLGIFTFRLFFRDIPLICISVFGSIFFLWIVYIEITDAMARKFILVNKYE